MNKNVKNIALYVNQKRDMFTEHLITTNNSSDEEMAAQKSLVVNGHKAMDNVSLFCSNQGYIHMY